MPTDRTQHQSTEELKKARELSLESTRPPAQIPGYKLQQFIGSGAYGEVWSATDLKTGRRVAVKFYTRRSNADMQLLAQEVEKLVVLSNDSYVVGLLDVGWDANPPYYVMDYIESGSLEDRLKQGNGMPASEAVELFQDIATGMLLLHGKGILHCDLKPGNVLLDQNGKPRLADFGQSRLSTDQTPALGTLFYMAPEQADMTAIPDAGWDVYGLGALLFSMLTGKPPYYSSEAAETIESSDDIGTRLATYRNTLMTARTPTEHRQVPGVDRSLADIIDKCIAADPKRRFNNVQSVLLALRQRELGRARRPLMLLGLIGPVLLMLVISAFGWGAFSEAMSRTELAVTTKAQESNDYAAKLAARSATEQVEEYFRVVRQLARDNAFLDMFDELMHDDDLKKLRIQLADPNRNPKDNGPRDLEAERLRFEMEAHELRDNLEQGFLKSRLIDKDNEYPTAASWFVSDRYGNQIASVFDDEDNRTRGCNYSYRTYFTGQDKDLALDDPQISHGNLDPESLSSRPIISKPHLSAVFQSKQSETWKVAFSAPIIRYGKIEGIVAVTADLGNLIEFENIKTQYVMLVDKKGTILQHPLFAEVLQEQAEKNADEPPRLPKNLATTTVDWSAGLYPAGEPVYYFNDPLGKTEEGIKYGYDRKSIVSRVGVKVQGPTLDSGKPDQDTGLDVLAVQDYMDILDEVSKLGSQLARFGGLAALVALGLVLGMLMFVNGMMRESRERLARAFSPTNDSSSIHSVATVAATATSRNATAGPADATDRPADQ